MCKNILKSVGYYKNGVIFAFVIKPEHGANIQNIFKSY